VGWEKLRKGLDSLTQQGTILIEGATKKEATMRKGRAITCVILVALSIWFACKVGSYVDDVSAAAEAKGGFVGCLSK
jgi:hypothetical protein